MVPKFPLVLLLFFPCVAFGSDKPSRQPGDVVSVAASGRYRLRLVKASQEPSPWDKSIAAVTLNFQLEFTQPAPRRLPTDPPENVYLEQADPLVSAYAIPFELVSTNKHFGWTENNWGCSVTIHNLEIGQPRARLHSLDLAVTLIQVTEWEQYAFNVARPGTDKVTKCGPLKIHLHGGDNCLSVAFTSFSRDEKDYGEYEKRVALKFPTFHSYGIPHTSVMDSKKRELFCSVGTMMGSGSSGMFVISRPVTLSDGIAPKEEKLEYPLSVTVRFPKRYRQERVTFQFGNITLPPLNTEVKAEPRKRAVLH